MESLFLTDRHSMDITNYDQVLHTFEKVKPSVVLHLAAATDVDRCEKEMDWAYKTNVLGTQNIVFCCKKWNVLLVYVSTSSVFNGRKKEGYTEFDTPDPVNVYARTKWEGEKIVQIFLDRYFIVRASWMIGGGQERDKKFVSKMIQLCKTKETVDVVNDRFGTITYAKDLLRNIRSLLDIPFYGLYHVASRGACTRYDIAREIAKYFKNRVHVRPASSSLFPLLAPRPESEVIQSYKWMLMGKNPLPMWQETLALYLKEWGC